MRIIPHAPFPFVRGRGARTSRSFVGMFDDIRNHDCEPTSAEREWLATDAVEIIAKSLILAMAALAIGLCVSTLVVQDPPAANIAAAHH
jgi:hypothetical protein